MPALGVLLGDQRREWLTNDIVDGDPPHGGAKKRPRAGRSLAIDSRFASISRWVGNCCLVDIVGFDVGQRPILTRIGRVAQREERGKRQIEARDVVVELDGQGLLLARASRTSSRSAGR